MATSKHISSTFSFDEACFEEYYDARERSLTKRDSMFYAIVLAVVSIIWYACMLIVGISTPLGMVLSIVLPALCAWQVYEAVTGRTIFWPRRAWTKTFQRFFCRHGVEASAERPWSFTCKTTATSDGVRISVVHDGEETSTVRKPYKEFTHIEVTEHLVILVAGNEVEPVWKSLTSRDYADALAAHDEVEDAVFSKADLEGVDVKGLLTFLRRKVRVQ
ncbi:MAG: hypothetical protein PHR15_04870 [Atopobiaceae bacterium]|jgi:hypothetical protein|nr:hypothetical protein [Atopobiaceae bacterium]MCH4214845.1 hypothetical protein [Atopobiaceae bacterium]MCH4230091.1 hypothetical protein [Atopobiaceae bacterium]MCH4276967.1 hypothetical protein [Atopobiaceae bacterium]MCI1226913.1 hypothetical protein [Atopobiaceae bacterium]